MAELLPCPFCGGVARHKTFTSKKKIFKTTAYYVECSMCKCQTHLHLKIEEAIEVWNTRTPKEQSEKEGEYEV